MTGQASSVTTLIATILLSNHRILNKIQLTPFSAPIGIKDLHEVIYLGYQPWAARHPDHVFESSWQCLTEKSMNADSSGIILNALKTLAGEFLEFKHGGLHVKRSKFGAWQQSVLSRICGLPVQATANASEHSSRIHQTQNRQGAASPQRTGHNHWANQLVPILQPYDALVEDYISREGLHETHLHLNGSTHAEQCWLSALRSPKLETRDFNNKWMSKNSRDAARIRELTFVINPNLSPTELYHQLTAAGHLRSWLIAAATNSISPNTSLPFNYANLTLFTRTPGAGITVTARQLQSLEKSSASDELHWLQLLFQRLEDMPSAVLERMLHCYLLLQNQYYRLLVQSEEQFGFDQFQKLTVTDLREPTEQDYLHRFLAMHGKKIRFSQTGYLEGRFAPKPTLKKNTKLLCSILSGYRHYLVNHGLQRSSPTSHITSLSCLLEDLERQIQSKPLSDRSFHKLALVAHFIKKPWSVNPAHKAGPYRFFAHREELKQSTNVLLQTLARWPRLSTWLRGIDAAANELDAPPEVFASCYRICQAAGLTRRSYHVGEDFPHLLTGLRKMLDALELLDLRDGDRIGHGTAMGMSPQLWRERMPGKLTVKRGEWMLDLLAAWRLLREMPGGTAESYRVAHDLAAYASHVFGRDISCAALERAMGFRYLDAYYLQESYDPSWRWDIASLNDLWQAEAKRVHEARVSNLQDTDLLWEWLSKPNLWERSEALVEVDAAYFDDATYIRIQQALMVKVAKYGVIIETLPSSNVRISHYHNFSEHHALRWMRVPGFMQEGDPEIMVSLGSDDPGIFAGDLSTEFYQLYAALRNQNIGDKAALDYLAPLNERGRIYRFHDPSIC